MFLYLSKHYCPSLPLPNKTLPHTAKTHYKKSLYKIFHWIKHIPDNTSTLEISLYPINPKSLKTLQNPVILPGPCPSPWLWQTMHTKIPSTENFIKSWVLNTMQEFKDFGHFATHILHIHAAHKKTPGLRSLECPFHPPGITINQTPREPQLRSCLDFPNTIKKIKPLKCA